MNSVCLRGMVGGLGGMLLLVALAGALRADPGKARPKLVIIMAEREYHTERTLPAFAARNLKSDFDVQLLFANPNDRNDIVGIEKLAHADIALFSIRRRVLPTAQMSIVRAYIASGKPLVGIRTTCHAFCLRNKKPPAGHAEWPRFDREVLGCFYHDHYGNQRKATIRVVRAARDDGILRGTGRDAFVAAGSLYQCAPLAPTAELLMTGRIDDQIAPEPVAWTNLRARGQRIFFTSLGHPGDFRIHQFVQLLRNGIYWAAGLPIPKRAARTIEIPNEVK